MNASDLNSRVSILKKQQSNHFDDDDYIKICDTWSQIINIHGKEFIEAQGINPNISKKVIIRYRKELDTSINPHATKDHCIEYKGIQYNILYIDNIREENRFMELLLELI